MATSLSVPKLTLRAVKGAPLTNDEMDANLKILSDFDNSLAALLGASLNPDGSLKPSAVSEPALADRVVSQRTLQSNFSFVKGSSGSANTFVVTFTPAIAAYANGQLFYIAAHQSNSGAATLQVDALAATPILKLGGLPLLGGEIIGGGVFAVIYWNFGAGGNFYMLHGAPTNPVNTSAGTGGSSGIPNGSFETDADNDLIPDQWVFGALGGTGTGTLVTVAGDQALGLRAFKFVSAGNGGGTLTSSNFIEVSPNRLFALSFQIKASQSVTNKVEVDFFSEAQAFISTTVLYSGTDVAAWTLRAGGVLPPSNAKYAKLRLTGAVVGSVAANVWFDDIQLERGPDRQIEITTAGSGNWKCPDNVRLIQVECIGGGGGGGAAANGDHGGGGAGGYASKFLAVTPGTVYPFTVGAAGAIAGAGGVTNFNTTIIANGGSPGALNSQGAGGTASGGDVNVAGGNATLPDGGVNTKVGFYGVGGNGAVGQPCLGPNGGGGGMIFTGAQLTGGAGGYGFLRIRYWQF